MTKEKVRKSIKDSITFYCQPALIKLIDARALSEERNVSQWIRRLIKRELAAKKSDK